MNLDKVLSDPIEFISRLTIRDKSGKMIPFGDIMSPEQRELVKLMQEHKRLIVLKPRQIGISTICRAFQFWKYYTSKEMYSGALISNKFQGTIELLKIDKRFIDGLPAPLRRKIKTEKRDELVLEGNRSGVKGFSGGGSNQRGYSFQHVHISEGDFIPEVDEVIANAISSVNDGSIIIETTANFWGSPIHKLITEAKYNDSWHVVFFPWSSFKSYSLPAGVIELQPEEVELKAKYDLTDDQIAWRRSKVYEMGKEKFEREYPLDIDQAYSVSGKNFFDNETLQHLKSIKVGSQEYTELSRWIPGDSYVIGVDPAGGIGADYSVAYVVNRSTYSPCAILASNKLSIRDFALRVIKLSAKYGGCLVNLELNNHGHAVKEVFNANSFYKYETFKTSAKSKLALYDLLRTYLQEHMIIEMDSTTISEMRNLLKCEKGLAPFHPPGAHDDRVIAYMLALYRVKDYPAPKGTWDSLMDSIKRKKLDTKLPLPIRT